MLLSGYLAGVFFADSCQFVNLLCIYYESIQTESMVFLPCKPLFAEVAWASCARMREPRSRDRSRVKLWQVRANADNLSLAVVDFENGGRSSEDLSSPTIVIFTFTNWSKR